jgi:hypothetical protein
MKKISTIFLLFFSSIATAQKLPNTQPTAISAPADIKIDGKTTEWNNQFQAYNHATDVFYTISNDDDRLYLTLQATDPSIINKILRGGVALAINIAGKKNDKGTPCITYPIFEPSGRPSVGVNKKSLGGGTIKVDDMSDSAVAAYNHSLKEKSKYIEVTCIPGIDTLISVYNTDGIKAAELFDKTMAYTYELSVDLKLLGLSTSSGKFAYHITLNGVNNINLKKSADGDPGRTVVSVTSSPVLDEKIKVDMAMMSQAFSPTDFWGEYTLAKK